MHHEEIELNFDASCQQILGLELEILWEARSTPTLVRQSHSVMGYPITPIVNWLDEEGISIAGIFEILAPPPMLVSWPFFYETFKSSKNY
jgi:hypothetical protein